MVSMSYDVYSPNTEKTSQYQDGDFLTREDVQFDLLHALFVDDCRAFTDPNPDPEVPLSQTPLCTFAELYVNGILNSPKCSTAVRQSMMVDPPFAVEYAKVALLVNIGRFNTKVAFDLELRSAHKVYVSVPCLMTSPHSLSQMQDVSRIKAVLRACLLSDEKDHPTATPTEVFQKVATGIKPPTTVSNLIFILFTHGQTISRVHFPNNIDLFDIFSPTNVPSKTRAKAFLWILFYYLEGPERTNPWADIHSQNSPGKVPLLLASIDESSHENVDTEKEVKLGRRMRITRLKVLQAVRQESVSESIPQEESAVPRSENKIKPVNTRHSNPKTMLHHAWNVVHSLEPLQNSDEEYDERDLVVDLERRLRVLDIICNTQPSQS